MTDPVPSDKPASAPARVTIPSGKLDPQTMAGMKNAMELADAACTKSPDISPAVGVDKATGITVSIPCSGAKKSDLPPH